ncbi:MAG: NAD(P)/FAD-dependent oxidoreductase [Steroidobacteraceae bacterium]
MKISRRQLISGAAAIAASSAIATTRRSAGAEDVDCVIIGAGLAGLNSAITLTDGGASTLVLESAEHVGGRCRTAYEWDSRIELGGVQIGQTYSRVRYMANRFGLPLGEGAHMNAPYAFVIGGKLVAASDWASSPLNHTTGDERTVPPHALGSYYVERLNPFQHFEDWLKPSAAEFDLSLAQWLDKQGASEAARQLIEQSRGGDSLESHSLLRMFQEATYYRYSARKAKETVVAGKRDVFERSAETSLHVEGGISRLTTAMAAFLGDRVRLKHRVVSIELDDRGCTVGCANGQQFRGRTAIVAVPFGVLRGVRIDPPLQGVQAEAVRLMPYGNQSQVWLRVKAPYWEHDGAEASMFSDGPFTLIRQQLEYDGKRELMSCLSFGRQSVSVDALSLADRGRLAISEIEKVRPAARGKLEFLGAQSWAENPNERGCSHSFVPGRGLDWAQQMAKPHHRLHFAGEHLRRLEVGMESAMETGEIAAMGALNQLG